MSNDMELFVSHSSIQRTVSEKLRVYKKAFQFYSDYEKQIIPNVKEHTLYFKSPIVTLKDTIKDDALADSEKIPLMFDEIELVSQAFLDNYEPLINAVNTDGIKKIGNELLSICKKHQDNYLRYEKELDPFKQPFTLIEKEAKYLQETYEVYTKTLEAKNPSSFIEIYENNKTIALYKEDIILLNNIADCIEQFDKTISFILSSSYFFDFLINYIRLSMDDTPSSRPIINSVKDGITTNQEQGYTKKIKALAKQLPEALQQIETEISSGF